MAVDRCVCFNVTFDELKTYADQHRCGLSDLRDRFGCGRGCAMCIPYIRAMLTTGQTTFSPQEPPPTADSLEL